MLNRCIIIGNVGKEPEQRTTTSGKNVVNFSVATTTTFKKEKQTEWHKVVAWNQLADIISQYVHKGSQIYVEGKLVTRSWDDKDGQKKYTTEIVANQMIMLGKKEADGFDNGLQNTIPCSDPKLPF